ncbi:hypothetical protein HYE67_000311 [Fusarium culmorum]|uniref:Heterokaryon incompatibility domain-containing protein n=1 Tax=Fusarium culmorum TaxID=5516 RepID=A0A7S8CXI6_FUSCU|nr:hypothetical protein HYE67_000311 [Fusarium culmorum]
MDNPVIVTHNEGALTEAIPESSEGNLSGNIQLKSAHQLCLACKSCLSYFCKSQDDPKRMKNNVLHSSSLSTVFTSAEGQCFVCSQLRNRIRELSPELGPGVYSDYSIICCWSTHRDEDKDKETKMWIVMFKSTVPNLPIHSYQQILQLGLWSKKDFGQYFDHNTNHGESTDAGLTEGSTGGTNDSDYTKDLAISWLARCVQNADGQHNMCNKGDQSYIPTRLLDVPHALENNVVRLVCPEKQGEEFKGVEYATLSYCWGPHAAEQNPMLLRNNLELWQTEGFSWDRLPKTFQDSLKIASWIGLKWIWIDSMCIIQDSKSDWKIETKAMDQIYSNAKVNISADAGEDSRSGCFVQRKKTDITPLQFATKDLKNEWIVTTDDTFERMNSAPSHTRAWIHREKQLSRRILHCTTKEMVWECCALGKAGLAGETMPRGLPFDKVFNGESKIQLQLANASNTNLSKRERRGRLHMLWNSICQDFANKFVSRDSDLPYILWGLADEFHTLFNGEEYVCGHWHRRAVVEIQSVSRAYESRPDNGFGKHASGTSISVNGFLRRLRFDYSGPEEDDITLSVVEEDEDGNDRIRHIGRHRNVTGDPTFRLTMDHCEKLPSCGLDCYALFTTLQETGDHGRHLSCVLLEHDSVVHNGPYQYHTYKRIGTMDNIGDLYSFELRYRVAPSVKVPDASVSRMDLGDTCTGEDVSEDIWNLLSQYLGCVRWDVIDNFRDNGMPDTNGYLSLEEDEEDESEWEEDSLPSRPQSVTRLNDDEEETGIEDAAADERYSQRLRDLGSIVLCIHDHPFSGLANMTGTENAAEAADHLQQVLSFESQTVAYGTNIREDPGEVLYQFDDVLDMWQKTHSVVPWLEQLETSVFTIV